MSSDTRLLREYLAVVWPRAGSSGERITLHAHTLDEAEAQIKARYSDDAVFSLWNDDDDSTAREGSGLSGPPLGALFVIDITGWQVGFQKVSHIKLLQEQAGLALADAKALTDAVLGGSGARVSLSSRPHAELLATSLRSIGAFVSILPGGAVRPNLSIDRTSQRPLRALCAAVHVER